MDGDSSSASAAAEPVKQRGHDTEVLPAITASRDPLQVGPYRVLGVIARGGMGTVYRGKVVITCEVPIGRLVAIKILRQIADQQERIRFQREAAYLQALRHNGIVRVLDAGEHFGQPYLVMPLVEGETLNELIVSKVRIDESRLADIGIQAAEALHTAHLAGILHRDIKPGNIMLTGDGVVKLLDFGLAQRIDGASKLTATGTVLGTPAYMSPEQASGQRADLSRRSDIYSLGACLYELLTGQAPFTADNSMAMLRRIIEEPLVPPSRLRPGITGDFETIVLKAMAKDPADRYPTAEHLAADLRQFSRGLRIRSRRPGRLLPLLRRAWVNRRVVAIGGLAVFLAVSVVAIGVRKVVVDASRATTAPPAQPPATTPTWVNQWAKDGDLAVIAPTPLRPYAPLIKGVQLASLPNVQGPVRLRFTFTPRESHFLCEAMISDRDVGRGYRLRLLADENGYRMAVLREDKVVASRELDPLLPDQPVEIGFERLDDTVSAAVGGTGLGFIDLVPIEGADADGVHIAYTTESAVVSAVRVERQLSALYVSALAPADTLRQDGRYARAIRAYEAFLHDHPDSELVRDARFRIGLCHEALADDERALESFDAVARDYRDHPRYVLAATFRAWGCSLRLGRYQEAEQYFDAIRRQHDLAELLASVPEQPLHALVDDYFARAEQLALAEPRRAAHLYHTGAELAAYLHLSTPAEVGESAAGDLLLALGEFDQATACFTAIVADPDMTPTQRAQARLRLAHSDRMRGSLDRAEAAYAVLDANPDGAIDVAQVARLWLGDLRFQRGDRAGAETAWSSSPESETLPGRIMRHLLHGTKPMPLPDDAQLADLANDVEYFNARLAALRGLDQQVSDRLRNVVRMG
ncbi:MAG: protein kinase, partial [Planctomycetes bacterium]|nr:protein kinase [Planctomycetota bacterium]